MPTVTIPKLILQPALQNAIQATFYYRFYLDSSWTLIAANVTINTDGTVNASPLPAFSIDYNKRYTVKALNEQCETIYQEDILFPCTQGCPDGFTLSPDNTYCYKIDEIAPTPPSGVPESLIAKAAVQYSSCGSYIYDDGYNVNGTGTSSQISTGNPFWTGGAGTCADAPDTTTGAMNRCAVWTTSSTSGQDIGFSVCVFLPAAKRVYIGIGCDNYGIIKVDGVTVVQQDEAALNAQYGVTGACFKVFHIYPIMLSAGYHYFEIFGHNVSGVAAVGIEVYDNTSSEIAAATSYGGLNLLFSTKNEVGQKALLGTDGYTCPTGYSLAACDSPISCKKITTSPLNCNYD